MHRSKCPIPDCGYETDDLADSVVVALLGINDGTHAAPSTRPTGPASTATTISARVEKIKRPTISLGGTSAEWEYFLTRWAEYKSGTRIDGGDAVAQLLECCEEDLRKDLTRAAGGSLIRKLESEVISWIKELAVRKENVMVARITLANMRQDRDESVRSFGARIKGQAGVCK